MRMNVKVPAAIQEENAAREGKKVIKSSVELGPCRLNI